MQPRSIAPEQFDHGESYRIGTSRRTRCEDSVRTIVGGRRSQQFEAAGTIENPEHNQVRKAFDVGQSGLVLGKDVEYAFRCMLRPQPFRDLLGVLVGTANISDRLRREHDRSLPVITPLLKAHALGFAFQNSESQAGPGESKMHAPSPRAGGLYLDHSVVAYFRPF